MSLTIFLAALEYISGLEHEKELMLAHMLQGVNYSCELFVIITESPVTGLVPYESTCVISMPLIFVDVTLLRTTANFSPEGLSAPQIHERRPEHGKIETCDSRTGDEELTKAFSRPPPPPQRSPVGYVERNFAKTIPATNSPIRCDTSFGSDDVLQDFHSYMKLFR